MQARATYFSFTDMDNPMEVFCQSQLPTGAAMLVLVLGFERKIYFYVSVYTEPQVLSGVLFYETNVIFFDWCNPGPVTVIISPV